MEVSVYSSFAPNLRCSSSLFPSLNPTDRRKPSFGVICAKKWRNLRGNRRRTVNIAAINEASVMADSATVEITWQIVVGAIGIIFFFDFASLYSPALCSWGRFRFMLYNMKHRYFRLVGVFMSTGLSHFAGVTPFVVAGIEFSKRIISQRRCQVCRGSGLILREKDYFKCPECGGFLPWQSWRRFFSM